MFAPKLTVDDGKGSRVPIQQFLQTAFLRMWEQVAKAVGDLDGVIGFQVRPSIALSRPKLNAFLSRL
jgi:hypothetical protein